MTATPSSSNDRPIQAVLLDLGNVLAFHDDALLHRRLASLADTSPAVIEATLERLWEPFHTGRLADEAIPRALEQALGRPLERAAFHQAWCSHFRLNEEIFPMVSALVGRVKLGLISNTHAYHFDHLRPQIPLLAQFDAVILSHEVGKAKPDPAIFAAAVDKTGISAEASAYFDDIPAYAEVARSLGMNGQVFTDAFHFREQLVQLGL